MVQFIQLIQDTHGHFLQYTQVLLGKQQKLSYEFFFNLRFHPLNPLVWEQQTRMYRNP